MEERWLEINQNQAEGSWRIEEGRPLVGLLNPYNCQLLSAGTLRTEALIMILEIIMAQDEGEWLAAQRVLTKEFWLP